MANFDISRVSFSPAKHYAGVRMQQGRVLTDDDWNENEDINSEDMRHSRLDIIGPYGSPNAGFMIRNPRIEGQPNGTQVLNFDILKGTLYLGGLRLEQEKNETFLLQDDYLELPYGDYVAPTSGTGRFDLAYLECWQQDISAVEDTELYETALGGPDTSTRVRTMQRVHLAIDIKADNCADAWANLAGIWENEHLGKLKHSMERKPDTRLTVSFSGNGASDDLCSPPVAGGYLGAENQAIRVQITKPGFFNWGFDDASPYYRVTVSTDAKGISTVTMLTPPKDQYHWPQSGQIVELLAWSAILPNKEKLAARGGFLTTVAGSYNPDNETFTITTPPPMLPAPGFGENWTDRADKTVISPNSPKTDYYYMRVWSRGSDTLSPIELPIPAAGAVALGNTGLQVAITGIDQVPDDYWIIAARPETPNQVLPWKLMKEEAPVGFKRFFAPLAVIQWSANPSAKTLIPVVISDCRKTFNPLTGQECCCTFTVGDGIQTHGDFNSIEDAISSLPADGGKICVLRGIHYCQAVINNRFQVDICGCGEQSIILPKKNEKASGPIFLITSSTDISIRHLTMLSIAGTAIIVGSTSEKDTPSDEITIEHNRIYALLAGIYVSSFGSLLNSTNIHIDNNQIGILDKKGGGHCIFCQADDVIIERNRMVVITIPKGGGGGNGGGGGVFNPCLDIGKLSRDRKLVLQTVRELLFFIDTLAIESSGGSYLALGGVQIGSSSERVWVYQNEIIGGSSNGITLCSLPDFFSKNTIQSNARQTISAWASPAEETFMSANLRYAIYEIVIEENIILRMGLSGIGAEAYFSAKATNAMFLVEQLGVYGNVIMYCALQPQPIADDSMLTDVGLGGITLAACENGNFRENRIEQNGLNFLDAISGIFILYAAQIEISDNRILSNGLRTKPDDKAVIKPGERGGIVIRFALQTPDVKNILTNGAPASDAVPAAKIQNNTVDHPFGHALLIVALGQLSIVNNELTSKGCPKNIYSLLAGAVLILDLGIAKDLLQVIITRQGPFGQLGLGSSNGFQTSGIDANLLAVIKVYEYYPSGKVLFADNQVCMDIRYQTTTDMVSAQLILSLDDIGYDNNQSECAGLLSAKLNITDLVLFNVILAGVTVRSNNNRFTEGLTITLYSLLSYGLMNTAVGNQSTHCLHVLGAMPLESLNQVFISDLCKNDLGLISGQLHGI